MNGLVTTLSQMAKQSTQSRVDRSSSNEVNIHDSKKYFESSKEEQF